MADKGWITKDAFADGALSADTKGRAAMADGYITTAKLGDSSVTNAKIVDGTITAVKMAAGAGNAGYYNLGVYGGAAYG